MKANALPLRHSHSLTLAPMQPSNSHAGSASMLADLAACLNTMPTHNVSAPGPSPYGLQPVAPGFGLTGLRPPSHPFNSRTSSTSTRDFNQNYILSTAVPTLYALTHENTEAMKANALHLRHSHCESHSPALAPMQPSNSHAGSASTLAACWNTMPTHNVFAPGSSSYGLQPVVSGFGLTGLRPPAHSYNELMNYILPAAVPNFYAPGLNFEATTANALHVRRSRSPVSPAFEPMQPSNSHAGSVSTRSACLSTMPTHNVSAPCSSPYRLQPVVPGFGWPSERGIFHNPDLRPHTFSLDMSTPPNYVPSSSDYTSCSPFQQLPSLSQSLQHSLKPLTLSTPALLSASTPTSSFEDNSGKSRDLGVRKKKYRDRFSLEEEEALVSFWFKHRFKYSVKSKVLWRLAQRNGVTHRDAISVQKHFDYILSNGLVQVLFGTFRRKGLLLDIIDSIDVKKDFDVLPLPSHERNGSESSHDSSDGISDREVPE